MIKYKVDVLRNENVELSVEIKSNPEDLLNHPMIPSSFVFVNKFGLVQEVISSILLKESKTDVYLLEGSLIYFNQVTGNQETLALDIESLKVPVENFSPWIKGNLDITTYRITKID